MVLLETARLRLRQFTPDDVDRLVELDSDPEVMRYVTFGAPTPRDRYVEVFLPRWFAIYRETPLLGYWAAEERATRARRRSSSTGSGGSAPTRSRHVRSQATPPRRR